MSRDNALRRPRAKPGPRPHYVLGDIARLGLSLNANCEACCHGGALDLGQLIARHGADCRLRAVARRLVCGRCGARPGHITIAGAVRCAVARHD